ncbi:MAG: hypothetical protein ACLFRW_07690 [Halorhodospira sp.]
MMELITALGLTAVAILMSAATLLGRHRSASTHKERRHPTWAMGLLLSGLLNSALAGAVAGLSAAAWAWMG